MHPVVESARPPLFTSSASADNCFIVDIRALNVANPRNMSHQLGSSPRDLPLLVFLKVRANRTKFDERCIGLCQVIKKTGEQNYLVEDNETGKTTWAHISQLQPVMERRV